MLFCLPCPVSQTVLLGGRRVCMLHFLQRTKPGLREGGLQKRIHIIVREESTEAVPALSQPACLMSHQP